MSNEPPATEEEYRSMIVRAVTENDTEALDLIAKALVLAVAAKRELTAKGLWRLDDDV